MNRNSFLWLVALITLFFNTCVFSQTKWRDIKTVNEVCSAYPNEIQHLFASLNLDYPGLEKVKQAYQKNDINAASTYLLEFYKSGNFNSELRKVQPKKTNRSIAATDTILQDVFIVQNVRGKVPYGADGHRDWYYKGPNNDKEWAWLSNRHSQLLQVYSTYLETGNPKYAQYMDLFLRDFIIKSLPYPAAKGGNSIWRGLEVSFRAKAWTKIFFGLINDPNSSPATQLLILSSLPDHAHYNRQFHGSNNWLTMEISALATVAAHFPEFKDSKEWLDYSIATMTESMKGQIYDDGVQTELTSHYHNVSLINFELFQDICDKANRTLPTFYTNTIDKMYSYIAHAIRPDGFRILNNDGDRGSDRDYILRAAKKYNKPDWEYIASNGKSGTKPKDGPSYILPWAGQLISRSNFGADAHWSFFDIGPYGSGHQHNDKLHISIAAYGRDMLVDAGRFAYTGEVADKFRGYAKGTVGHNLLLIDGNGQNAGPLLAKKPLDETYFKIEKDFDYTSSSFESFIKTQGTAKHTRSLFYVRGQFWVIADRVTTDRPRKIDALWHWHPSIEVKNTNGSLITDNAEGNLAIIPISKQKFDIEFVKGQEKPEIQGWYSPEYNEFGPNLTNIMHTNISKSENIVWLLLPSKSKTPKVKTEIISENDKEVVVSVQIENKKWKLTIPFENSTAAKLE